jgi:two-component system chemotaxis response regulator CheY
MTTGELDPALDSESNQATSDSQPKKPTPGSRPKVAAEALKTPPSPETPQPAAPQPAAEASSGCKRALVVDDEPANRDFLVRLLQQAKLDVYGAESGSAALKLAESLGALALVVIDHKLPDMDGVDLLVELRQKYPDARMIMATMLDERALMAKAFENGCNVFLVKPFGFMELFRRLQQYGPDDDELNRMVIDQYGLRPYRG